MIKNIFYKFLLLTQAKKKVTKPLSSAMGKTSFYELRMTSIDGREINFADFKGKKVLIVNTASVCGYTPQYAELEEMHVHYKEKLVIIGFPSNNFGGQEPGTNSEIATFCQKNYGVTFLLMEKSDVKGKNQNPVYHWLTNAEENGWNNEKPGWNFGKYLISENGELLQYYNHVVIPGEIAEMI